jgi:hypothetical protein
MTLPSVPVMSKVNPVHTSTTLFRYHPFYYHPPIYTSFPSGIFLQVSNFSFARVSNLTLRAICTFFCPFCRLFFLGLLPDICSAVDTVEGDIILCLANSICEACGSDFALWTRNILVSVHIHYCSVTDNTVKSDRGLSEVNLWWNYSY